MINTKEKIYTGWAREAIIYHIFPLGALDAPQDHDNQQKSRILNLLKWIPHWKSLGVNTILLGPVFESKSHGYDVIDLFQIDSRLGSNEDFEIVIRELKQEGFRIVLDAVFNHTGRNSPFFEDVKDRGSQSPYVDWYKGIDFNKNNPLNDGFSYDTWDGHWSLIKLDTANPQVQDYLLEVVDFWIEKFHIDGLRLDAADVIDPVFWPLLNAHCKSKKSDFWLMGESVFGDYSQLAKKDHLDSVTNYECYKGLWSSHNDKNFFEIAYSLGRQFENPAIYSQIDLYNFVDNHDVDRINSILHDSRDLATVYMLLFTIPGIPSIYYGSEFGFAAKKGKDDWDLRPYLDPEKIWEFAPDKNYFPLLQQLIQMRSKYQELVHGDFKLVKTDHEQLAYIRSFEGSQILVLVNQADHPANMDLDLSDYNRGVDILNGDTPFNWEYQEKIQIEIPAKWGRVLLIN